LITLNREHMTAYEDSSIPYPAVVKIDLAADVRRVSPSVRSPRNVAKAPMRPSPSSTAASQRAFYTGSRDRRAVPSIPSQAGLSSPHIVVPVHLDTGARSPRAPQLSPRPFARAEFPRSAQPLPHSPPREPSPWLADAQPTTPSADVAIQTEPSPPPEPAPEAAPLTPDVDQLATLLAAAYEAVRLAQLRVDDPLPHEVVDDDAVLATVDISVGESEPGEAALADAATETADGGTDGAPAESDVTSAADTMPSSMMQAHLSDEAPHDTLRSDMLPTDTLEAAADSDTSPSPMPAVDSPRQEHLSAAASDVMHPLLAVAPVPAPVTADAWLDGESVSSGLASADPPMPAVVPVAAAPASAVVHVIVPPAAMRAMPSAVPSLAPVEEEQWRVRDRERLRAMNEQFARQKAYVLAANRMCIVLTVAV
jgi:hypothetical protein